MGAPYRARTPKRKTQCKEDERCTKAFMQIGRPKFQTSSSVAPLPSDSPRVRISLQEHQISSLSARTHLLPILPNQAWLAPFWLPPSYNLLSFSFDSRPHLRFRTSILILRQLKFLHYIDHFISLSKKKKTKIVFSFESFIRIQTLKFFDVLQGSIIRTPF